MSSGEDWLLRPVMAHLCHYESLIDGSLTLEDVATLNEALDVQAINHQRMERRR